MKKSYFIFFSFVFVFMFSASSISQDNRDMNLNFVKDGKILNVPTFTDYSALTTASWTTLTASPHAVSRSGCVYIRRNDTAYIFQFGGGAGAQFTNLARYNITTATWTNNVGVIPFQVSAGAGISDGDSVIYIFGGNSPTLGKACKYNIVTGVFTTLPDMPTPATDFAVVKYQDTVVYVIAGGDGLFGTNVNSATRIFKMRSATWSTTTNLPLAKGMISGGIWRDTIIVGPGWNGTTGTNSVHKGVINPTTLAVTWSTIANYPGGGMTRAGAWFVQRPNQGAGIVFSGGAVDGATVSAVTNIWNFCTQAWQPLPSNSQARSNLRGTGPNDSTFYIVGGFTTAGVGTFERLTFSFITGTCSVPLGINTNQNGIPYGYELAQNYPNPFNPTTTISFGLPQSGFTKLVVTDVLGREVAVLVNGIKTTGVHSIDFDASKLSSGIYFYSLSVNDFKATKKMLLIK